MNMIRAGLLSIACALIAACANEPRSRDTANPDVSGATLAVQVCSNCHGVTGNSTSPNFPNLAAQQIPYLVAQLSEFKNHDRQDPAGFEYMWGLSHRLSDKQIQELAAYFGAQTLAVNGVEGKPERIDAGKSVFENGIAGKGIPPCGSCHGPDGRGNGVFPRIAGQHADYLFKQLMVFQRSNDRPEGAVMKTVAHNLSKENIADIADYLQALPSVKR